MLFEFQASYNAWCENNSFETKLLKVLKAWKEQKFTKDQLKQMSIDPNL